MRRRRRRHRRRPRSSPTGRASSAPPSASPAPHNALPLYDSAFTIHRARDVPRCRRRRHAAHRTHQGGRLAVAVDRRQQRVPLPSVPSLVPESNQPMRVSRHPRARRRCSPLPAAAQAPATPVKPMAVAPDGRLRARDEGLPRRLRHRHAQRSAVEDRRRERQRRRAPSHRRLAADRHPAPLRGRRHRRLHVRLRERAVRARRSPTRRTRARCSSPTRSTRSSTQNPQQLLFATTAADVERAKKEGKIAILIGVEGGHAIEALARQAARPLRDAACAT